MYERRLVTVYALLGTASTLLAGNFAAMVVAAEPRGPFGLLSGMAWARSAPVWADTVAVLTLVAVPPLMGSVLAYMVNWWPQPHQLPPWTTPEHLRAARVLHRRGLLGDDVRTNQVARALSEASPGNPSLPPHPLRNMLPVSIACLVLMVACGLYVTARALREGDLNGLASGVNTFLLFVGSASLVPLSRARNARAHRFLALYDAARQGPPRQGGPW
ncbi:hypothetical protein ACFWTE_19025 [Nocardiopsis sp. NPDC058631]|uniref:hypothetical protein n=1 Tax=Nocardiopsis sp. NPDC058631 TaxID=3346566 RepID=UPI00365CC80B